ncbi:MAG: hypothetical protein WC840_05405, partial [Candidatus Peribacteraceae bacterium]
QSFIDQLKAKYAVEPMYGLDGKTIIGYGGVLGTTVADATRGITDVPITGVDIKTYSANPDQIKETPNSKNTMILFIYGSNQFPEQNIDGKTEGFDNLVLSLRKDYLEVWPVISGENPSVGARGFFPGLHVQVGTQLEYAEELIATRARENPNLQFVMLVGYSWGGEDVYQIADWITNENGSNLKIAGTVYVDAIKNPSTTLLTYKPENRLPPGTEAMLNLYQSQASMTRDDPLALHGDSIDNPAGDLKEFWQHDFDANGDVLSHTTIDDHVDDDIYSFIKRRVEVISH